MTHLGQANDKCQDASSHAVDTYQTPLAFVWFHEKLVAQDEMEKAAKALDRPEGGWTWLIDDLRLGRWRHPETGRPPPELANDMIVIREDLDGGEGDFLQALDMTGSVAVVADPDTWDALGHRIGRNLGNRASAVILERPHADLQAVEELKARLVGYDSVVAVGSGTVNDLCKYATLQAGTRYCVFATAASMDGYASSTASMSLESGLKISLPAQAAAGVFIDLKVSAAAPGHLAASGFGDSLCRSVAQTDWWMSHRLLGTFYADDPYLIGSDDETETNKHAARIGAGDLGAIGYLNRLLVLSGIGVTFTGVSNHGSMGEHQISHYIDCFAGARHPGSLHGQQVGVATVTMARLQHCLLSREQPPLLAATRVDPDGMARRMGMAIARQCEAEYRKKALDAAGAERLNRKLAEIWPALRQECRTFAIPAEQLQEMLASAGGPVSAAELGVPADFYREAVRHAHEMRNRFSFADLACDAGLLDDFAASAV